MRIGAAVVHPCERLDVKLETSGTSSAKQPVTEPEELEARLG